MGRSPAPFNTFAVNELAAFLILLAIIRVNFYSENRIVYQINESNHSKQTVNRTPTSTPQLYGGVVVPHGQYHTHPLRTKARSRNFQLVPIVRES